MIEFVAFIGDEALVWQFDVALVSVLLVYGMQPEALFGQVTTYGEVCCSFWGKQVGYIHQHLGLCVWLQYIQYVIADDGIELSLREVGTIVVVIARDVISLFLQFVRIETKSTSEVENLAPEQIVLHEVSRWHGEIRALDGC